MHGEYAPGFCFGSLLAQRRQRKSKQYKTFLSYDYGACIFNYRIKNKFDAYHLIHFDKVCKKKKIMFTFKKRNSKILH